MIMCSKRYIAYQVDQLRSWVHTKDSEDDLDIPEPEEKLQKVFKYEIVFLLLLLLHLSTLTSSFWLTDLNMNFSHEAQIPGLSRY